MEKSLDGTKRIISKERLGQNAWAKQRVGGGHKAGETLERACLLARSSKKNIQIGPVPVRSRDDPST